MLTKKLTNKDEIFIREYLISLSPEDAAIKAGYSKTVAHVKSYLWVCNGLNNPKPHVYEAIQKKLSKKMNKLDLTAERVLEQLSKIAFYDKKNTFDSTGEEIPTYKLPNDVFASNVKTSDQINALNTLAKYLGLLNTSIDVTIDDVTKLTPEERKEKIEILKQKALSRR